jgi:hypothetical protein
MFARLLQAVAAAAVLAVPSAALADPPEASSPDTAAASHDEPRLHLDVAPALAMPTGPLANLTGPAIGGLLGGSYPLSDNWEFVGHAGYLGGSDATTQAATISITSSVSYAPTLAGARYYFSGPSLFRFYAMGEAGLVFVSSSASVSGDGLSSSSSGSATNAGGALSLGMLADILDVRVGLFSADASHMGTSTSALLAIGFRFASF